MREFKLPDPGEGLLEAEIVAWKVAVGDVVAVNDILLEIETAKSLVELPSPYAGVVTELLAAEGDTVEVGTVIVRFEDSASVPGGVAGGPSGAAEPDATQADESAEPAATGFEPTMASQAGAVGYPADVADDPASAYLSSPAPPAGASSLGSARSADAASGSTSADQALGYPAAANPGPANPASGSPALSEPVQTVTGPVQTGAPGEDASAGSMLVGYGVKPGAVARRPRKGRGVVAVPETDQVQESYDTDKPVSRRVDEVTPTGRVAAQPSGATLPPPGRPPTAPRANPNPLAKPPVRRIARDLGIDLGDISGSGPGGTITAADVVAAAGGRGFGDRRTPLRGVRREMFRSMTESLKVPQATAIVEADVTGTVELLDTLRERREFAGLRLSPLLVFAKASCLAIARNPEINSSYDELAEEIVQHERVNLGIAAATPRGLVVPNIKGADRMNLLELTQALNRMVAVAKEGRVQPADLASGTFTITNIGVFGVDGGTPILNAGEAAIMCLGTIRRKPWVVGTGDDERIEPRSVCMVSLTFDHRLVDGEAASKFLADVATIMAEPGLSLLY